MNKLLLSILLIVSFSANAGTTLKYETKCIKGYVFAVVMARTNISMPVSVSMVQILRKDSLRQPPQPMRCK